MTSAGHTAAQVRVADRTSEIAALGDLLDRPDVAGCLISADALHTQTTTARHLVGRGADYLLTVKANQPALFSQANTLPWPLAPVLDRTREVARLRETIAECDRKLARYRAALEAGTDAALVNGWMKETQAQRSAAKIKLDRSDQPARRMSKDDIMAIVDALGDIADVLHHAGPEDKTEVYKGLGLRLRYQPGESTVRAEMNLAPHHTINRSHGEMVRVRGGT